MSNNTEKPEFDKPSEEVIKDAIENFGKENTCRKVYIDYDETDENFPTLIVDDMTICLYKGLYFRGVKDSITSQGKEHDWEKAFTLTVESRSLFLFTELVKAFAVDLSALKYMVKNKFELIEEFVNVSLNYYGKNAIYKQVRVNTEDYTKPYIITKVLKIYNNSYLNERAIHYLLSPDLLSMTNYFKGLDNITDIYLKYISSEIDGVETIEDCLERIPKKLKVSVGLIDAGGLKCLFREFVESLGYVEEYPRRSWQEALVDKQRKRRESEEDTRPLKTFREARKDIMAKSFDNEVLVTNPKEVKDFIEESILPEEQTSVITEMERMALTVLINKYVPYSILNSVEGYNTIDKAIKLGKAMYSKEVSNHIDN